jgi:predicted RNA-binding Zn-ribbon protein involved in translation (DUF1610 family)
MKSKVLLFGLAICLWGCGGSSSYSDSNNDEFENEDGYEDDTYCADVEYYNPNTGTRSTYQLNVDVEDNELVKIHWPNGGWLDDDHFYPEELDGDECSIISDKGYHYEIVITGPKCSWTDEGRFLSDVEDEEESFTCPNCGEEKGEYDDYCSSCQHEMDYNCSKCGLMKMSYEKYCEDCQVLEDDAFMLEMAGNVHQTYKGTHGSAYSVQNPIMIIIRKNGAYYILGGSGSQMPEMGDASFDASVRGYQTVTIASKMNKGVTQSLQMRILGIEYTADDAEERLDKIADGHLEIN